MKPTDIRDRRISRPTAGFIGMRETLSDLYTAALHNLTLIYDEETALEILEKHFIPEYKAFEASIDKLIIRSISNSLSEIGGDTI